MYNEMNILDYKDIINNNYDIQLEILLDKIDDNLFYVKKEIAIHKMKKENLSPTLIEELYNTLNEIKDDLIIYRQTLQDHHNFHENIKEIQQDDSHKQ